MDAMLRISLYSYSYLKLKKNSFVFVIIAYVFSSTKLEKGQNRFCLEARQGERVGGVRGKRWPNVCTYE
jgi:hypothetical protein